MMNDSLYNIYMNQHNFHEIMLHLFNLSFRTASFLPLINFSWLLSCLSLESNKSSRLHLASLTQNYTRLTL